MKQAYVDTFRVVILFSQNCSNLDVQQMLPNVSPALSSKVKFNTLISKNDKRFWEQSAGTE